MADKRLSKDEAKKQMTAADNRIKGISSIADNTARRSKIDLKKQYGTDPGNRQAVTSVDKALNSLSKTTDALARGVKTITVETARGVKNITASGAKAMNEYARAISEDIHINRKNFMVTTIGKFTPLVGYAVAKMMETTVFKNMIDRMKVGLGKALDSVTSRFKRLASMGWEKGKEFWNSAMDRISGKTGAVRTRMAKARQAKKDKKYTTKAEAMKDVLADASVQAAAKKASRTKNIEKEVPHMASGGYVQKEGLAKVHAAEVVQPVDKIVETIVDTVNKRLDAKEDKQKKGIFEGTMFEKSKNKDFFGFDKVGSSIKSGMDIMFRKNLALEQRVMKRDKKNQRGLITSFMTAYSEEAKQEELPLMERQVRAILELKNTISGDQKVRAAAWNKMLYEHPVFHAMFLAAKGSIKAFTSPLKFLFKKRGKYANQLSTRGTVFERLVDASTQTFQGLMEKMDDVIANTFVTAESTSITAGSTGGKAKKSKNDTRKAPGQKGYSIAGAMGRLAYKVGVKAPAKGIEWMIKKAAGKNLDKEKFAKWTKQRKWLGKDGELKKERKIAGEGSMFKLARMGLNFGSGGKRGGGMDVKDAWSGIKDSVTGKRSEAKRIAKEKKSKKFQAELQRERNKTYSGDLMRQGKTPREILEALTARHTERNKKKTDGIIEKKQLQEKNDFKNRRWKRQQARKRKREQFELGGEDRSGKKTKGGVLTKLLKVNTENKNANVTNTSLAQKTFKRLKTAGKFIWTILTTAFGFFNNIGTMLLGGFSKLVGPMMLLMAAPIRKMFGPMIKGITKLPIVKKVLEKIGIGAGTKVAAAKTAQLAAEVAARKAAASAAKKGAGAAIKKTAKKTALKATEAAAKSAALAGAPSLLKSAGAVTSKVASTIAEKTGIKAIAKFTGKGALKSVAKKIPGIGLLFGLGFGLQRLMKGDLTGAAMEVASGAASTIPGLGTAASVAIDAGLVAKDVMASKKTPETKKVEATLSNEVSFRKQKNALSAINKVDKRNVHEAKINKLQQDITKWFPTINQFSGNTAIGGLVANYADGKSKKYPTALLSALDAVSSFTAAQWAAAGGDETMYAVASTISDNKLTVREKLDTWQRTQTGKDVTSLGKGMEKVVEDITGGLTGGYKKGAEGKTGISKVVSGTVEALKTAKTNASTNFGNAYTELLKFQDTPTGIKAQEKIEDEINNSKEAANYWKGLGPKEKLQQLRLIADTQKENLIIKAEKADQTYGISKRGKNLLATLKAKGTDLKNNLPMMLMTMGDNIVTSLMKLGQFFTEAYGDPKQFYTDTKEKLFGGITKLKEVSVSSYHKLADVYKIMKWEAKYLTDNYKNTYGLAYDEPVPESTVVAKISASAGVGFRFPGPKGQATTIQLTGHGGEVGFLSPTDAQERLGIMGGMDGKKVATMGARKELFRAAMQSGMMKEMTGIKDSVDTGTKANIANMHTVINQTSTVSSNNTNNTGGGGPSRPIDEFTRMILTGNIS